MLLVIHNGYDKDGVKRSRHIKPKKPKPIPKVKDDVLQQELEILCNNLDCGSPNYNLWSL